MKRVLYLLLLFACYRATAQNYPITGITISLPASPDANTATWASATPPLMITATSRPLNGKVDGLVAESKVLVTIKKGGAKVCGAYSSANAPASAFTSLTKVWNGAGALSLLGQSCTLAPGDYELSVQFFMSRGAVTQALSEEKTRAFSIRSPEADNAEPPQLIAPIAGAILQKIDLARPVVFRWLPRGRRQYQPLYRLRVWQLMQGQNATQARSVNQPILTKDIENITQAAVTGILTGPCKPPYLCDYVWNVQELNRDGKPVGGNNGTSETFSFSYREEGSNPPPVAAAPVLTFPPNDATLQTGSSLRVAWTTSGTSAGHRIRIVEIKGTESPENAIRTNKPFFEKDSCCYIIGNKPIFEKDSGDWVLSVPPLVAGNRYAWAIQTLDREGKPVGGNNGMSKAFTFRVGAGSSGTSSPKLLLPANKSTIAPGQPLKISWIQPGGTAGYRIRIDDVPVSGGTANAIGNKPFFEKDSCCYITGNKPIFEKDSTLYLVVDKPVAVSGHQYAWSITGLNREGKPTGSNNGRSETFTFRVNETAKPADCNCSERPWTPVQKINYTDGTKKFDEEVACNGRLKNPVQARAGILYNASAYPCTGDCTATYQWKIINRETGRTILGGTTATLPVNITAPPNAGNYQLEVTPVCGTKTCSPCGFYFSISGGATETPQTGGTGSICGMKFNDLNGNGKKDPNEPGIAGWQIVLSGAANMTATTGTNGDYCFGDLTPGRYSVSEGSKPGWTQTAPADGRYVISLAGGQHLTNIDFGNTNKGTGNPEPPIRKPEDKREEKAGTKKNQFYYSLATDYNGDAVPLKDTLFFQVENSYSPGANPMTYTIRNLSNERASKPAQVPVKSNEGLVRIALPVSTAMIGKGETGLLTVGDSKHTYYLSFKRD